MDVQMQPPPSAMHSRIHTRLPWLGWAVCRAGQDEERKEEVREVTAERATTEEQEGGTEEER